MQSLFRNGQLLGATKARLDLASKKVLTMLTWIPNLLSLMRVGVALAFPLLNPIYWVPTIVFAAITEWADGFLARRLNAVTPLGQALDPIADKALFISVLGTLLLLDIVSWWQLLILALRDLTVLSGVFWIFLKRKEHVFASFLPKRSGKWATACQYGYFFGLLYTKKSDPILFGVTAAVGAWSAADYIFWFLTSWRNFSSEKPTDEKSVPL